jgi:homeobox-leucine zipper protein
MNQIPSPADFDDDAVVSSPNSTVSSFQMGPGSHATSGNKRERDDTNNSNSHELERACSRASDEEDGETTRKKLRLSKEQSALLEESFKEHNTLNPVNKRTPENVFHPSFFKPCYACIFSLVMEP